MKISSADLRMLILGAIGHIMSKQSDAQNIYVGYLCLCDSKMVVFGQIIISFMRLNIHSELFY